MNTRGSIKRKCFAEFCEICKEAIDLVERVLLPRLLGGTAATNVGGNMCKRARLRANIIVLGNNNNNNNNTRSVALPQDRCREACLVPVVAKSDQKIFALKMIGDYYRYLAEIQRGEAPFPRRCAARTDAYDAFLNIARGPESRRQLFEDRRWVFSRSVFRLTTRFAKLYPRRWVYRATALDEGLEDLDATENARAYKDAALILKLIKDNIFVWQSYTPLS